MPEADLTVLRHRPRAAEEPRGNETQQDAERSADLANRIVYQLDDALAAKPDFAIIASPASHHLDVALPLAEDGVHLCIEKPISNRMEGVDRLIGLCRRKGLALFVGYNYRFCEPLRMMSRALDERRIGRVLGFRAEVGQYLPDWRAGSDYRKTVSARDDLGGGALLELSHELDFARWLVGEAASVHALAGHTSDLEIDVEDLAEVSLSFQNGVIGSVHLDMLQRSPVRRCKVIGTDGTLEWCGLTHRVRSFLARSDRWSELHPAKQLDRNEMYLAELRHFLNCVRGKETPRVSGEDGKRALEIALAAKESARTGKTIRVQS